MAKEQKVAVEFNPATMGKDLKDCIREASDHMVHIESHKEGIKAIKDRVKDELGVDGKLFGKLLKIYHKQERDTFENESSEVVETYDSVFKN